MGLYHEIYTMSSNFDNDDMNMNMYSSRPAGRPAGAARCRACKLMYNSAGKSTGGGGSGKSARVDNVCTSCGGTPNVMVRISTISCVSTQGRLK